MHKEVGELMVDVDAACYIIDCLPNMNAATVTERCVPLVNQLRKARPEHTDCPGGRSAVCQLVACARPCQVS